MLSLFVFDDARTGCSVVSKSIARLHTLFKLYAEVESSQQLLFSLVFFSEDENDTASWLTCASEATL